jgi:hypothetical protein
VIAYRARSQAPPEAAWSLVARPSRWHEWAPHIRGAWGLGEPEVVAGASGAARLLGLLPVPATVTEKRPGESWTWKVGPVSMVHAVRRRRTGCEVAIEMHAPPALEAALALSYGPVVGLLVKRLASVAAARGDLS